MSWSFGETPPRGRFVALFDDGSGAVVDAALVSWFEDAGFAFWLPLPDGMRLFFEVRS